jgi:hypothetical protein
LTASSDRAWNALARLCLQVTLCFISAMRSTRLSVTGIMLIYTYSRECEEVACSFQSKIRLLTSKLGIALTKGNKYRLPQLGEYQKELKDLFAMHSQRAFHRLIYFKWSKRPEPMQRPLRPPECGKPECGPFSASSWYPVNQVRDLAWSGRRACWRMSRAVGTAKRRALP